MAIKRKLQLVDQCNAIIDKGGKLIGKDDEWLRWINAYNCEIAAKEKMKWFHFIKQHDLQ